MNESSSTMSQKASLIDCYANDDIISPTRSQRKDLCTALLEPNQQGGGRTGQMIRRSRDGGVRHEGKEAELLLGYSLLTRLVFHVARSGKDQAREGKP
jgi:hypothetical protein